MTTNRKKKPAPSRTRKPNTTFDASSQMWVYSDNPSTWPSDCGSSSSSGSSSYDSSSSSSSSYDSGSSSSSSSDCGGF